MCDSVCAYKDERLMAAASSSRPKSLQNGVKLSPPRTNQTEPPQYSFSSSAILLIFNKCPFTIACAVCLYECVTYTTVCCALGLVIQWRANMISAQGHELP